MSDKRDKTLVEVLAESLRTWLDTLPDDPESESEGDDDE